MGLCVRQPLRPSMSRSVRAFLLLLAISVSGCATTFDIDAPKIPSHAIAEGARTTLGRQFATHQAANPGASGFDLLASGRAALLARVALAEAAERTLDLQYYSVAQDATTELLLERIIGAARRGVRVRMLLDDIEVSTRAFALRALSAEPTIQVRLFHPFFNRRALGLGRLLEFVVDGERLNRRMHNKLWVADNAAAIFGSRNLGDAYFDAQGMGNFSDVDLIAVGPVVADLSRGFDAYWNSRAAIPFVPRRLEGRDGIGSNDGLAAPRVPTCPAAGCGESSSETLAGFIFIWGRAEVTYDEPDSPKLPTPFGIQHGMVEGDFDANTQSELLFISPYFIPGRDGRAHLIAMRDRGVHIAVLTNSLASTDAAAAHAGYARYRVDLLESGVELFELRPEPGAPHQAQHLWGPASPSSLHAKVVVIDRSRSIVGSLNQDPRSRLYNTEAWVSIESAPLAERLADLFEEGTEAHHSFRLRLREGGVEWITEQGGREVRYRDEPLASPWQRFLKGLTSLFVPEALL